MVANPVGLPSGQPILYFLRLLRTFRFKSNHIPRGTSATGRRLDAVDNVRSIFLLTVGLILPGLDAEARTYSLVLNRSTPHHP